MQRITYKSIEKLEFNLLANIPKVRHGVILRRGGCSEGPFESLNTSYYVEDKEVHVTTNLEKMTALLKHESPDLQKITLGKGCHKDYLERVDFNSANEILDCDGLVSCTAPICLTMKHADCQIALFYDPIHHCAANIHAGWRGSVKNIYATAIKKMQHEFGTNPADLLVCISPSLGPEKAEFINYQLELPQELWQFQISHSHFDFWTLSEYQLQQAGILSHHIEIARLCTYANSHDFFSYRRDKITGRHTTYITLLP